MFVNLLPSKPLELKDYDNLHAGTAAAYQSNAVCMGSGVPIYLPHSHRFWEYGSALEAIARHAGVIEDVLDVGCGHSLLGPAVVLEHGGHLTELDPLELEERGRVLPEVLHGAYTQIQGELPYVFDKKFQVVLCISVLEHIPLEQQEDAWFSLVSAVDDGGLLIVTVDYSDETYSDAPERKVMFNRNDVTNRVAYLKGSGFEVGEVSYDKCPPQVNDYNFYRIIARKL
jgi:hypothetical protein